MFPLHKGKGGLKKQHSVMKHIVILIVIKVKFINFFVTRIFILHFKMNKVLVLKSK